MEKNYYTEENLKLAQKVRSELSLEDYISLINKYYFLNNFIKKNKSEKNKIKILNHLLDESAFLYRITNLRYVIYFISKKENITLKELALNLGCEENYFDNLSDDSIKISSEVIQRLCNKYNIVGELAEWNDYKNIA